MGLAALYCGIFAGIIPAQPQGRGQEDIQSQAPGSQRTLLTLKLRDRLLKDVVATIRRKVGVNIIMDEGIDETVSIDLENVEWRTALDMVAEKAGCLVIQVATLSPTASIVAGSNALAVLWEKRLTSLVVESAHADNAITHETMKPANQKPLRRVFFIFLPAKLNVATGGIIV